MSTKIEFFSAPELKQNIKEVILLIQRSGIQNSDQLRVVENVLISMVDASNDWDNLCQYTIKMYGTQLRLHMQNVKRPGADENSAALFKAIIYLFLIEADLSMAAPESDDFLAVRSKIEEELKDRPDQAGAIISTGKNQLPIRILKRFLNSSELINFKDAEKTASNLDVKVTEWKKELEDREKQVVILKETLDTYTDAFNFVGLYKGFSDLEKSTKVDLQKQKKNLKIFGFLMTLPAAVDFYLIASKKLILSSSNIETLIAGAVASITLTLVFMYFFRIVLRDVDSKDAQIMQIRLRMTLCQFIQKYAEYATNIREKSPDVLSKFENIIFSGIVGTQDKLPSTFDGLEQLSSIIKSSIAK